MRVNFNMRLYRIYTITRMLLLTLAVLWTGWIYKASPLPSFWMGALLVIVIGTAAFMLFVSRRGADTDEKSYMSAMTSIYILDLVMIIAGVLYTGGIDSPLFVLLLPLIISTGIVWGQLTSLQFTTLVVIAYIAVVMFQADVVPVERLLSGVMISAPTMIAVYMYTQVLIQDNQIERRRRLTLEDERSLLKHNNRRYRLKLEKVEDQANKDGLTGLYNHAYFQGYLKSVLGRAFRYKTPVTLLLIDIDHFKAINDTYGHLFGDAVLKRVAELISQSVREDDMVARYGGEEMAVVLPNCSIEVGREKAERIRKAVERENFYLDGASIPIKVTVSVGVSESLGNEMQVQVIDRADKALYEAKNLGRNQVVLG